VALVVQVQLASATWFIPEAMAATHQPIFLVLEAAHQPLQTVLAQMGRTLSSLVVALEVQQQLVEQVALEVQSQQPLLLPELME
jgi:hypothetical protein